MNKKQSVLTSVLKYIFVFLITACICFGLLFLVTFIPRSAIKSNIQESADYLCNKEMFEEIVEGVGGSKQDRYADSILLGIIWQLDSNHPLSSMMETAYYSDKNGVENEALRAAVTDNLEANKEYLRYWHGSSVWVKPLLLFLNIKEIYIFNAAILIFLYLLFAFLLVKKKIYIPLVGFSLSLILVSAWFVPFSLEYTWCFLIMFIFLDILLLFYDRLSREKITILFLFFGIITSFFDFLTTELITLLVPLLLLLWFEKNESSLDSSKTSKFNYLDSVKRIVLWGFGYSFMWMLKWLLAAIVLQRNVLPDIKEQIDLRVGGEYMAQVTFPLFEYMRKAIFRNVKCLFPLEYGWAGIIVAFIIFAFTLYILFVYHGKSFDKGLCVMYIVICMIPYIRYMVLHNHSFIHFGFTYRSQMITLLSIFLCMDEVALSNFWKHLRLRKINDI